MSQAAKHPLQNAVNCIYFMVTVAYSHMVPGHSLEEFKIFTKIAESSVYLATLIKDALKDQWTAEKDYRPRDWSEQVGWFSAWQPTTSGLLQLLEEAKFGEDERVRKCWIQYCYGTGVFGIITKAPEEALDKSDFKEFQDRVANAKKGMDLREFENPTRLVRDDFLGVQREDGSVQKGGRLQAYEKPNLVKPPGFTSPMDFLKNRV
ncbi:hypothetical protein HYALB_00001743 [Hymenoscyphus albidus]|uniref:Uncharacterized protein n=1 Tax=Hymenoscyphus albidus TaxID=595503 RepID=A0A9N9Q8H9_9HELO|nr:hypothetical protein HYALB_00001743 [Hymenoscyphus albidus]